MDFLGRSAIFSMYAACFSVWLSRVVELMRRANTASGLRTSVNGIRRADETKHSATEQMKQELHTIYDELMPKWNYCTVQESRQQSPVRCFAFSGGSKINFKSAILYRIEINAHFYI